MNANGKLHNVVTSFHEEGFQKYGKACIESFLTHWPRSVRFTAFYEGENFPFTPKMSWRPYEEVEYLSEFLAKLQFPLMLGKMGPKYNIQYDASQSRKVFIEMHAMKRYGGKVFWMDADCITHADVPDGFLDELLPDDKLGVYCGREGWSYPETGFIGFNAGHPLASEFYNYYLSVYLSGMFLTNPGWHDCWGFDVAMKAVGPHEFVNLSAHLPKGTMHPIINTVLGKYIDHRKGPRKESKSGGDDLVIERDEPYWNERCKTAETDEAAATANGAQISA